MIESLIASVIISIGILLSLTILSMNALVKVIISIAWVGISLYWVITSIQNLITVKENLDKANQELENTQKYGCPNPTVMEGLVMCP